MTATSVDPRGPLIVARAAYRLDTSDEDWLNELASAARPYLDFGWGISGAFFRRQGADVSVEHPVAHSSARAESNALMTLSPAELPEEVRLAAFGMSPPCSTGRRIAASVRGGGVLNSMFEQHGAGATDLLGLMGMDPSGHGVMFVSLSAAEIVWPERKFELWTRVSIHIAAALRLRRALRNDAMPADPVAVLDDNARVLHTQNGSASFRELLRQSARIVLRAASPGGAANETMSAWRALVAGELSLIDTCDTDGKRLIIARRNRPAATNIANDPLSARERHVVDYARLGHPNKLIAYALGISVSTVASHLRAAMRKLKVTTRVALIRVA